MQPLQLKFYNQLNKKYPILSRGVDEARAIDPVLVDQYFEKCLQWLVKVDGEDVLEKIVDGYASFTLEVNRAQQAYERRGCYEFTSFAEANARVYQQADYMRNYYQGVFAILFCWSHYVELMDFYLHRFVSKLSEGTLLEVAPGHGAWGVLALDHCPKLRLQGLDISPTSLEMAPKMAFGAGVQDRCTYTLGDAAEITREHQYDAAVCSFMLEHLENPAQFCQDFAACLKPGALAYVTLALTAAQTDHIYEFKRESEAILFAEQARFDILEVRVAQPLRVTPNARFIPRVQAMVLRRKSL